METNYFCDLHNKELLSYKNCIGCPNCKDFPDHISCPHIRLKTNPKLNSVLPKRCKYKPTPLNGKRVLIERTGGGLGDLLMITVAVKEIKRKYPDCHITFRASPDYMPVLERNPHIDRIISLKQDCVKDAFISFSKICPAASYEMEYNPIIRKHRINLFANWLGLQPKDTRPVFCLAKHETNTAKEFLKENKIQDKRRIGIVLRCAERWRDWPYESNLKLMDMFLKNGYAPIVFDSDSEKAVNRPGIINACGRPIRFAASVLSLCHLLISPDGGLNHLAAALDVPQLGLFGPTDPKCRINTYKKAVWLENKANCPIRREGKYCWYYPAKECKTKEGYSKCMADIEVEKVYEIVNWREIKWD